MTTADRPWLRGDPALCSTTVVLLASEMFHDMAQDGIIPGGVVIAKIDDTATYGPWERTATDGRNRAAGLIFTHVRVGETAAAELWAGGGIVRGQVFAQRLPLRDCPGALDYIAADQLTLIDFHNL